MNEEEHFQDEDEISLFELWERLRSGWRTIVAFIVLGLGASATVIVLQPNRYEAVAIVAVGQVAQLSQANQAGGGGVQYVSVPVEPATQAVERLKTSAFQQSVANALQGSAAQISVQLVKGTLVQGASALIEVKAKAETPVIAKKTIEVSIQELAKRHAEMAKPYVNRFEVEMAITRDKLKRAEDELLNLGLLVSSNNFSDDRFTQLTLLTSLRLQKETEVFGLRQTILNQKAAIAAPSTEPAKAIEEVFVSDTPVSPKNGLIFALGLVGGMLLGIMSVFISAAWRQAKASRK